MLLCLFLASWQVNKSTSIRVACYFIRKSPFFYFGFRASWQVNKSTSWRVACYSIRQFSFFYSVFFCKLTSCLLFFKDMFSCYFVSFLQAAVLLSTLLTCHKQKTLARSQGFSGAYETRTRDLLRDRQAF